MTVKCLFFESKPIPGRISLPKDNYENSNFNLPLLDRARLDSVRPIADSRRLRDGSRFRQRGRQHLAGRERDARR